MAFVTCQKFKQSQEAQDEAIKEQSQAVEDLKKNAMTADDALLDKSDGNSGGKVTVENIKREIAGDVAVSVKANSGLTGNGTKANPLALNLGSSLTVGSNGKINVDTGNIAGIRLVDAGGTVHLGNIVE